MDKVKLESVSSEISEAAKSKKEYQAVLTENDLKAWAKKIDKCNVFAIDTETSSLDTMTADLIGISLACNEGEGLLHSY
jgi:DNA polymerase-1